MLGFINQSFENFIDYMASEAVSAGIARVRIKAMPTPRGEGGLWDKEIGSRLGPGKRIKIQGNRNVGEAAVGEAARHTPLDTILLISKRE